MAVDGVGGRMEGQRVRMETEMADRAGEVPTDASPVTTLHCNVTPVFVLRTEGVFWRDLEV